MSNKSTSVVATMGIDIGKNSFHVIGLDPRGAIVLRQDIGPRLHSNRSIRSGQLSGRECSIDSNG